MFFSNSFHRHSIHNLLPFLCPYHVIFCCWLLLYKLRAPSFFAETSDLQKFQQKTCTKAKKNEKNTQHKAQTTLLNAPTIMSYNKGTLWPSVPAFLTSHCTCLLYLIVVHIGTYVEDKRERSEEVAVRTSFNSMGLREDLLHGLFAFGMSSYTSFPPPLLSLSPFATFTPTRLHSLTYVVNHSPTIPPHLGSSLIHSLP